VKTMVGSSRSSWDTRLFLEEKTEGTVCPGMGGERPSGPAEERADHPAQRLGSGLDPSDPASSAAVQTAAETYRRHENGQTLAQPLPKKKP
jgi:hypothetical protein